MIKPIQWETLTQEQKAALRAAGDVSALSFTALWFNITQGEPFRPNWHHHYFDWAARQMITGRAKCIVINVAPGATKTEFFSIGLTGHVITKFPRVRILNVSYSKDLVNENSERVRALFKSAEFAEVHPFEFGKDKVDDWTLERNGKRLHQVLSRPSGGQITGVRGGFITEDYSGHILCDDFNKMDDLFSKAKRDKANRVLVNTVRSRRACTQTPVIFMQQRGHTEDSTAFMLNGGAGLKVDLHIKIPALIDQDYIDNLPPEIRWRCIRDVCKSKQVGGFWSYWPAKDTVDDLIALRDAHPYTFHSQYQQDPASLDGGIFKESDFMYYGPDGDMPEPPHYDYRFVTVDTAQKTSERNDWSVFNEWGVFEGCLYRLDGIRGRWEATALQSNFESFVKKCHAKNSPVVGNLRGVYVEDKASGTGLIQSAKVPVPVTAVQRSRDKTTRAMDVQPYVGAGYVRLRAGDPSNIEFVSEVVSFRADDSHPFDDQTDTMIDAVDIALLKPQTKPKRGVWSKDQ